MTLQAMNYRIITVGRLQLNSTSETRKIALSVARALGKPIRFRIGDFDAKHKHLREGPGTPLLAITHPDNRSPKMIFVRRPSLF